MPPKNRGRNRSRRRKNRKVPAGKLGEGEPNQPQPTEQKTMKKVACQPPQDDEEGWKMAIEIFTPCLVAGFASAMIQNVDIFHIKKDVFMLVPALLGFKGNLEITLASRLSTHANLGRMDSPKERWSTIVGNLSLIQCQAMVLGLIASLAAMIMGWVPEGKFNMDHGVLLCASSLVTASLASFVLGLVMVAVIILSRQCNINPDNVATPIAASLGDLTTLALLSWISSLLFDAIGNHMWLAPLIIVGGIFLTPVWAWIASRNPYTREVLRTGWRPLIYSLAICSVVGLILDYTVANFQGLEVFQPVINGVGGNLVAVQACRISTALHRDASIGKLPLYEPGSCIWHAFCKPGGHARTARVLLLMVVPGHLIFTYTISYLQAGHLTLTPIFVVIYLVAALMQVFLLLYIAHVMIHWMWARKIDPDSTAIPFLTALGDLLGAVLLALAFQVLHVIGDREFDAGD